MNIILKTLLLVLICFICACASGKPKPADIKTSMPKSDKVAKHIEKDEMESRKFFKNAESAFKNGDFDVALDLFLKYVEKYQYAAMADEAYFRIGEIQMKKGDMNGAAASFQKIITDYIQSDFLLEAKYRLSLAYFRTKNFNDVIQTLKSLIDVSKDKRKKTVAKVTIADSYLNLSDFVTALKWYSDALEESLKPEEKKKVKRRMTSILENKLERPQLEEVADLFDGEFLGEYARYVLILKMIDDGENQEAKVATEILVDDIDNEEISAKVNELLQVISQRMDVRYDSIGCILPLSGRFAPYGEKVLKGIQLAAGIFGGEDGVPLNIIVKDSEGDQAKAAAIIDELVDKEKVVAIIGPLLSRVAEASAVRAQERGVPMMALSQKAGIPKVGNYIFRNFLTSQLQTRSLAEYAVKGLGLNRFAVLYPSSVYGEEMMNLFWNDVQLLGGEVVGIESYAKDQYDFAGEIKRLVGMDNVVKKEEKRKEDYEKIVPIVDFEAVFIPDSYNKAALIAPQLIYNDILNIKLLGPNSWHSGKLVEIGGEYVDGAVFVDGFYPESRYEGAKNFTEEFVETFGEEPGMIEAHAYDSASMIVDLIKSGAVKSRIEMRDALLSFSGYGGATGNISVNPSGDVDKKLFLMTVDKGKIKEIDSDIWSVHPDDSATIDNAPSLMN